MSKISDIRARVGTICSSAGQLMAELNSYDSTINTFIGRTKEAIGGTATGADKDAIDNMEDVRKTIKDAVSALDAARKSAKKWADSL